MYSANLKTSDALMAHRQTNSVLVYVRMYAVTERGVVGLQADCSVKVCILLFNSYVKFHSKICTHC